jgi:Family of unknown function (DUF5670)
MVNLLYLVAGVLVIIWAISFFGYETVGIIHLLLFLALMSVLLRFVFRKEA